MAAISQANCAGEIAGCGALNARQIGGADGATVRNLSGTRDRAGMGTLESVDDGVTRQRAPTEELAGQTCRGDALRHQDSGAPGRCRADVRTTGNRRVRRSPRRS